MGPNAATAWHRMADKSCRHHMAVAHKHSLFWPVRMHVGCKQMAPIGKNKKGLQLGSPSS